MAGQAYARDLTLSFVFIAFALTGCGSSSTSVLSPTPVEGRCDVAVRVSGSSFGAAGGQGTFTIQTARECAWSVTERPSWVFLSAALNTQGSHELAFVIDANRSTASRSGDVVIGSQRTRITQEGATCPWTLTPAQATVAASGGQIRVRLSTEDFCAWEVAPPVGWIEAAPAQGRGSGEITFEIRANSGDRRSARVQVGGTVINIDQRQATPGRPDPPAPPAPPVPPAPQEQPDPSLPPREPVPDPPGPPPAPAPAPVPPPAPIPPPPAPVPPPPPPPAPVPPPPPPPAACTYTVSPLRFELSRKSQRAEFSVVTESRCEVRATSNAGWLDVSPNTRTGSGTFRLDVSENRGRDSRTGTVTLTGSGFTTAVVVIQNGNRSSDDRDDGGGDDDDRDRDKDD